MSMVKVGRRCHFRIWFSQQVQCAGISSTLVLKPANVAVSQGATSAVTFQCSSGDSSSFVQWYNSLCVTTMDIAQCTDDLIYTGSSIAGNVPSRFNVTEENGATHVTRDLHISSTELADAGVYLCAEAVAGNPSVTDSSSAELIVLGNYLWLN